MSSLLRLQSACCPLQSNQTIWFLIIAVGWINHVGPVWRGEGESSLSHPLLPPKHELSMFAWRILGVGEWFHSQQLATVRSESSGLRGGPPPPDFLHRTRAWWKWSYVTEIHRGHASGYRCSDGLINIISLMPRLRAALAAWLETV